MIRAIIADDEQATCAVVKKLVESQSIYVEIAGIARDGRESINMIRKLSPDLVFLDIQMPYFNAFQIMERCPNTKYIIITAYDSFEYAQKALRLNAVDILLKPINIDQLIAAINRAFGWKATPNNVINQTLDFIHSHYNEDIKLQDLAKNLYITSSALSRSFHASTGKNFLDYLHSGRIQESKRLLEEGCPIKDVAYKVGYNNMNNFYKHFKELEGQTPAEYSRGKTATR